MTRTVTTLICLSLLTAFGCAPAELDDASRMLVRFELDARDVYVAGPDGSLELRNPDEEVIGERILVEPSMCSMNDHAWRLAGPGARDCGVVELDASPEAAEWCAAEAFTFGQPFVITYVTQGIAGPLEEMLSGNAYGDVFFTVVDARPCEADVCPSSFRSSVCEEPSVSESGSITCERYRPLLEVLCD
ncbi:MAG: hypothetical protein H6719_18500 [Sandaracinaceae bacterium]|nr:hypothetical protein [Sandaracinaceae bacterium]